MSYAIDLPIAANTWIWHCPLVEGDIHDRLRTLSAWGFDAVETPLESVGDWDAERARATLDEIGMDSLVGCVMAPGRELGAADRETIERTKAYVRGCIDHAVRQGAPAGHRASDHLRRADLAHGRRRASTGAVAGSRQPRGVGGLCGGAGYRSRDRAPLGLTPIPGH